MFIDPSAQGLKEEIKRLVPGVPYNVILRDAKSEKNERLNSVKLGISRVQKLLTYDMISLSPLQENAIDEFGTYEYDKKSIERGKEEPVKIDDHAMDAIRYLVMGMWKHLKRWLPEAEDEEE